jgi:hypothetical protein
VFVMRESGESMTREHDPRFLQAVQMLTIHDDRGMSGEAVLLYARATPINPMTLPNENVIGMPI